MQWPYTCRLTATFGLHHRGDLSACAEGTIVAIAHPHHSGLSATADPRLRATGYVGRIRLSWRETDDFPGPFEVHAVSAQRPVMPWVPSERTILATTADPRFVHTGLGPLAQRWAYAVVSATGVRVTVLGTSRTSVTVTGVPIATVGQFNGSTRELALAPTGFVHYPSRFPRDVDFRVGFDKAEQTWSYLQPGPDDVWAGRRCHRFRLRFDLTERPLDDLDFALWLVDRHPQRAGSASVIVNGLADDPIFFDEPGPVLHVHDAQPGPPGPGAGPAYLERPLPRALLHVGENVIDIVKDQGSWIAYDALGVFRRT